MKYLLPILFLLLIACNNNKKPKQQQEAKSYPQRPVKKTVTDTTKHIWIDRLNGSEYYLPDSIAGKEITFYINNPRVATIAKDLYRGRFRPEDNDSTTQLLSYVTTNDSTLRPFYRWCLDFTIEISDGALAEYPGVPALEYATKFPKEFFNYMDKDASGKRYKEWTEIIAYSGLYDYDGKQGAFQKKIISRMMDSCKDCSYLIKKRINTFAKDVADATKLED